jgi:hypothetical protein
VVAEEEEDESKSERGGRGFRLLGRARRGGKRIEKCAIAKIARRLLDARA